MNQYLKKPYIVFWITIPFLILYGLLSKGIISINVGHVYINIQKIHFGALISILNLIIGLGYWIMSRFKFRLSKKLSSLHITITILGLVLIWIISFFFREISLEWYDSKLTDIGFNNMLDSTILILILIILIGQILYLINLLIGLIRTKKPVGNTV